MPGGQLCGDILRKLDPTGTCSASKFELYCRRVVESPESPLLALLYEAGVEGLTFAAMYDSEVVESAGDFSAHGSFNAEAIKRSSGGAGFELGNEFCREGELLEVVVIEAMMNDEPERQVFIKV